MPYLSNALTLVLLALVIWKLLPQVINNFKSQGRTLVSRDFRVISLSEGPRSLTFPAKNKKQVTIFWATWCGPCKIEMSRLQNSIDKKTVSGKDIIAINPFETPEEVEAFLKNNKYEFTFIEAPEISNTLNINSTPTTLLIDNGKIVSQSSGMSIIGIWKIENFLNSR